MRKAYNMPVHFPKRLVIAMYDKRYSAVRLAKELGCDRRSIYSWQNGTTTPNVSQLIRLCQLLDVNADYLLGLSDEFTKCIGNPISEEEIIVSDFCRKKIHNNSRWW